jgi:SAM-dependent methyltransferase
MEFEGMMKYVPLGRDSTVLELGSGDGFQLELLRKRFSRVLAIDPKHAPARKLGFAFAIAEALPFNDCAFDLIVSNCVLEHLKDRKRGLEEMLRVLRPGGCMAHVVPARFWKAASLLFNPLGYPMRVIEKWWALRRVQSEKLTQINPGGGGGADRPEIPQVLGRWIYPPIHGTYTSHLSEYQHYGRKQWLECFSDPCLVQVADAPLVCATQFGFLRFRLIHLRKLLAASGLESSRAFILRKI